MNYKSELYNINDNLDLVRNRSEVVINDKEGFVASCGFLSKPLVFTAKNNFDVIFNMSDKFSNLRSTLVATGVPIFTQGEFSRQYFTGGGYTTFNLNTRIVSDLYSRNGKDSMVLSTVKSIMKVLSPKFISDERVGKAVTGGITVVGEETKGFLEESVGIVKENGKGLFKLPETTDGASIGQKTGKVAGGIADNVVKFSKETFEAETTAGLKAIKKVINRLDKAAQIFGLSIGNYFRCNNMVIKEFSATYSRELDDKGNPLFADLVFLVETREILTRDGGENGVENCFGDDVQTPRVKILNGGGRDIRNLNNDM